MIVRLTNDPDTPTYQIHGVRNEDRRIAVNDGDTVPLTLINKLLNISSYDDETDRLVEFEVVDDTVDKIRAFVRIDDFGTSLDKGTRLATGLSSGLTDSVDDISVTLAYPLDNIGSPLADPLTVVNQFGKVYQDETTILAAYDDVLDQWVDITPTAGEVFTGLVQYPTTIPAATWDGMAETLTPGTFSVTILERSGTAVTNEYTLGEIIVVAENCARRSLALPSDVLLVVKLRWEGGRFTLIWDERSSVGGKRVRGTVVDPGEGFVLTTDATFELTSLTEVYGGSPPTAPLTVEQTFGQGYVAGQLTEAIFNEASGLWENLPLPRKLGCHLGVNSAGFESVTPLSLAGSGMGVSFGTGPGGCDQLTATGGLTAGCGIIIASGVVSVDVADLAGSGLDVNTEGGACQLTVDLCEALEAKAVADSKTSGTYVPAVVDGVCSLLEVVTGCDGS
jgi:hypothetical protein